MSPPPLRQTTAHDTKASLPVEFHLPSRTRLLDSRLLSQIEPYMEDNRRCPKCFIPIEKTGTMVGPQRSLVLLRLLRLVSAIAEAPLCVCFAQIVYRADQTLQVPPCRAIRVQHPPDCELWTDRRATAHSRALACRTWWTRSSGRLSQRRLTRPPMRCVQCVLCVCVCAGTC